MLLTGHVELTCVASQNMTRRNTIIAVVAGALGILLLIGGAIAIRWQSIFAEVAQLRVNRVKRG